MPHLPFFRNLEYRVSPIFILKYLYNFPACGYNIVVGVIVMRREIGDKRKTSVSPLALRERPDIIS
jgi:hypothetical protein